jgi:hypothetical protein
MTDDEQNEISGEVICAMCGIVLMTNHTGRRYL